MGGKIILKAFTLVELLVVISIITLATAFTGPAISALTGTGTVNKAIADFSGTLQLARSYAMANHTYVRVAISESVNPSRLVVLSFYSANGTMSAGSATPVTNDMANTATWPTMSKPLTLENLGIFDVINGTSPITSNDDLPSRSPAPFNRTIGGTSISFKWVIQFTPTGEAAVLTSLLETPTPARYIKIAMDRPAPGNTDTPMSGLSSSSPQNQFILRLSGVNGSVTILRKGGGI